MKPRNYALATKYEDSPEQVRHREMRNRGRELMGLSKGDPREVDHIDTLKQGGSNARSNLRAVSRHFNRSRPNPRGGR